MSESCVIAVGDINSAAWRMAANKENGEIISAIIVGVYSLNVIQARCSAFEDFRAKSSISFPIEHAETSGQHIESAARLADGDIRIAVAIEIARSHHSEKVLIFTGLRSLSDPSKFEWI